MNMELELFWYMVLLIALLAYRLGIATRAGTAASQSWSKGKRTRNSAAGSVDLVELILALLGISKPK
jgi:hypothetical protein